MGGEDAAGAGGAETTRNLIDGGRRLTRIAIATKGPDEIRQVTESTAHVLAPGAAAIGAVGQGLLVPTLDRPADDGVAEVDRVEDHEQTAIGGQLQHLL